MSHSPRNTEVIDQPPAPSHSLRSQVRMLGTPQNIPSRGWLGFSPVMVAWWDDYGWLILGYIMIYIYMDILGLPPQQKITFWGSLFSDKAMCNVMWWRLEGVDFKISGAVWTADCLVMLFVRSIMTRCFTLRIATFIAWKIAASRLGRLFELL